MLYYIHFCCGKNGSLVHALHMAVIIMHRATIKSVDFVASPSDTTRPFNRVQMVLGKLNFGGHITIIMFLFPDPVLHYTGL